MNKFASDNNKLLSELEGEISKYMCDQPCAVCHGERLKPVALGVRVFDKNITAISNMSISELIEFFEKHHFDKSKQLIAEPILNEINSK